MPALFSTPNTLSNPDIDWNPSTGSMSHYELPRNGNGLNRNWGVEGGDEAWGDPVGRSAGNARTMGFKDPFANPRRRSLSHQRPVHSRSHSASGERRMHSIGNIHGHVNGNGYRNHYDQHPHHRPNGGDDYEYEDEDGSEDEPFFPEDQLSTPGRGPTYPNLNQHHSVPTHPHVYPPYPYPYTLGANPPYAVPPDPYQQMLPYGYPPPHSNPIGNAAFFNTGKDVPKQRRVVHRRKSVDDIGYTDWGGNQQDAGWDQGGWSGRDEGTTYQQNRRGNFDNRGDISGQTWQNFMEDGRHHHPAAELTRPRGRRGNDGQRRHASAPTWGEPIDNDEDDDEDGDDLEPGEIRIHGNGNVNSGGWNPTQGGGGNNAWGDGGGNNTWGDGGGNNTWGGGGGNNTWDEGRGNNTWADGGGNNDWNEDQRAGSPGFEALSRNLADLRLDQQRNHQQHRPHRRHASSPPELIEQDRAGGWGDPTWGDPIDVVPPHTQRHANGGQPYVNVIPNRNGVRVDPQTHHYQTPTTNGHHPIQGDRREESSSGSSYTLVAPNTAATWNQYEKQRRRAYADASNGWNSNGSGNGSGIGSGVASQLKEKAMRLLRGAGIGSITLHPILRPASMLRPNLLSWDVRRIPHPARAGIPIGEAMAAFSEPASKPGLQHMHLIVPIPELQGAAWQLDVYPDTEELHSRKQFSFGGSPTSFGRAKPQRKKNSTLGEYDYNDPAYDEYSVVIRCADVLSALSRMLQMSATSHDYHALPKIRQKQVYDAFMRRCREIEDPSSGRIYTAHPDQEKNTPEVNERVERKYRGGLKRLDFLCGRTRWEGLESNGVDAWAVKLGKPVAR